MNRIILHFKHHDLEDLARVILDIYRKMEEETQKGNWDLRIRVGMLDETFDRFFGNDPLYFTDVHPNSRCMSLIAQWETHLLLQLFENTLPRPT